ncbi:MAG: head-tail adaptor protein [Mesorhizobium sp.]|nr:MAG: head-tail adaptor protein [Mesorhizobium sp.]
MPKLSAGTLLHRVAFDKRETANPDAPADYGNTVSDWVEQFACRAAFIHLRGGETVMASRLQGKHTQVIRVRSSSLTRSVSTDWRVRDTRTAITYNVRDITPSDDRQFIDILCESGTSA